MQNSGLGMALSILHFSKIVALPSAIFSLWHNISAVGLVYCWKKNRLYFWKEKLMQISAKNQIKGKVTSVIHGTSYTQVAVEQTDADGNTTGSFIHAAIPVDICKKMELTGGNIVTCIFPAATVILAKHD